MKNIRMLFYLIILQIAGFPFLAPCKAQNSGNRYGLSVINDLQEYRKSVLQDGSKALVDVLKEIPGLVPDIRYATTDNFLKEVIYEKPYVFTRRPVAEALKKVQTELNVRNLGLKIFDAYRPYRVTVYFYEKTHDSVYCAVPWIGSRHNRGCAVDVSLVDLTTGIEVEMPTKYDDFSEKAHPDFMQLSDKALINRKILITTMEMNGFRVYPSEWWHFDFKGWENYEIMDISFDDLNKLD